MKKTKTIIIAVLIVLWLAVIWGHSLMSGEDSSNESSFVTKLVTPVLELFVGKGNVTEHLVRKIAHFTEFFILGALMTVFLNVRERRRFRYLGIALGACALSAAIDETIQIFSANRGPSVADALLDTCGAAAGILFLWAVITACRRLSKTSSGV